MLNKEKTTEKRVAVSASMISTGLLRFYRNDEEHGSVFVEEFKEVQPKICWLPDKFWTDIYRYNAWTWYWKLEDWELFLTVYGE